MRIDKWSDADADRARTLWLNGSDAGEIAEDLGVSIKRVQYRLVVDFGTAMAVGKLPDGAKIRNCLKCRESFLSDHKGNRLCDRCNRLIGNAAPIAFGYAS